MSRLTEKSVERCVERCADKNAESVTDFSFQKYLILAIACSFAPLSIDLVAPALPGVADYFSVPLRRVQLSIFVFLAGYGVGPFFWGGAADRWGRTPAMVAGLLLYIVSSMLAGIVTDMTLFIVIRFVQGFAAAAGVIISRAILRDVFDRTNVTKAVSTMFLWMVLIPISAPLLGGLMADYFPWYCMMFFMVGVGVVTLFFYWRLFAVLPVIAGDAEVSVGGFRSIITNQLFCLSALANMFVITIMVIFAANYSHLASLNYHLGTQQLGYLLALFNGAVAAGAYLARLFLMRMTIYACLLLAGVLLLLGWSAFMAVFNSHLSAGLLIVFLAVACTGKGIIMSLCAGQALVPFSSNAGAASAYYTLIQSIGSTVLAFGVAYTFSQTMDNVLVAVLVCAFLSFVAVALLHRGGT